MPQEETQEVEEERELTPEETAQAKAESAAAFKAGYAGDDAPAATDDEETDDDDGEGDDDPDLDEGPAPAPDDDPALEPENVTLTKAELDDLLHRVKSVEGRVGSQEARINKAADVTAAVKESGDEAPTKAQIKAAFKDSDKMKELKSGFPEWGEAMEEMGDELHSSIESIRQELSKATGVDVEELTKQLKEALREESAEDIAEVRTDIIVSTSHRGWKKTINTPEFAAWIGKQDAETIALGDSNDPFDAVDLLDKYTESSKAKRTRTKQNNRRIEESVAPTDGKGGGPRQKTNTSKDAFRDGYNTG